MKKMQIINTKNCKVSKYLTGGGVGGGIIVDRKEVTEFAEKESKTLDN